MHPLTKQIMYFIDWLQKKSLVGAKCNFLKIPSAPCFMVCLIKNSAAHLRCDSYGQIILTLLHIIKYECTGWPIKIQPQKFYSNTVPDNVSSNLIIGSNS